MIKKIAISLFIILIFGWIGFAVYSITEPQNTLSYFAKFSKSEDETIIAIHHPRDFDLQNIGVDCNQKNLEIFTSITPRISAFKSAFLSKKRNLMLFQTHEKWSIEKVRNVFENGIYPFSTNGTNSFVFGNFKGEFKGKELLIYAYDLNFKSEDGNQAWNPDFQASFSLLNMVSWETKDFYFKENHKITYTTKKLTTKKPHQLIDDLNLFGNLIPKNTSSYVFYEKEYLKKVDPSFAKSPIREAMNTGGIIIESASAPVFIFDLKEELVLTEYLNAYFHLAEDQVERKHFKSFPICASMNSKNPVKDYSVYSTDGFGFICSNEVALDAVLLELEMRKSLNAVESSNTLFSQPLPKKVSARSVSRDSSTCLSWVRSQTFETKIETIGSAKTSTPLEETKNYFTMNPGKAVLSFLSLSGRGNIIMETEGEIIGYKNGSLKWRISNNKTLVNKPVALNTINAENEFVLLPFEDRLEVIDKMGRKQYSIAGNYDDLVFPCIAKGQPAFGIMKNNVVSILSVENGKVLKKFTVNEKILHWKIINLANKSTLIIHTEKQMLQIDYNTGKKQTVNAKSNDFVGFTNRGVLVRGPKGMQEIFGNKVIEIQVPSYWKYCGEFSNNPNVPEQLYHDGKTLVLVKNGKVLWKKEAKHTEVSEVLLLNNQSGIFGVRDALENKIYLYNKEGNLVDNDERPAQRTFQITPFGLNGCSITTYLNDFVIQFNY